MVGGWKQGDIVDGKITLVKGTSSSSIIVVEHLLDFISMVPSYDLF